MRKIALFLFILFSLSVANSQELKENKVDEFTKHSVKRTSYETLKESMKMSLYIRVSKIDSLELLDIKMMLGGSVFSIREDQEIMFKLDNDQILSLKNLKFALTCRGCGAKGFAGSAAEGVQTSYPISPEQHALLRDHKIQKVRIYTSKGYVEEDIKDNKADLLSKSLALIE